MRLRHSGLGERVGSHHGHVIQCPVHLISGPPKVSRTGLRSGSSAAAESAAASGVQEHRVIRIDLRQFGGSALTGDQAVPKDRDESELAAGVPITYVPARNTIFLAYALAWAEVLEAADV